MRNSSGRLKLREAVSLPLSSRGRRRGFSGSALAALWLLAVSASAAEDFVLPGLEGIPPIVAEVNGKPITRNELMRELVGSAGAGALDRLVRRKIVEQQAKKLNVVVTDEQIEQEYRLDIRDLNAELIRTPWDKNKPLPIEAIIRARYRMSIPEYKQSVIRHKLLIQGCVAKDLQPTEEDLRKVYDFNRDYFQPPTKYHASHILISPFDPRDMHRGFSYQTQASKMQTTNRERTQMDEYRRKKIDLYRDHRVFISEGPGAPGPKGKGQEAVADEPGKLLEPMWEAARKRAQDVLTEIKNGRIKWIDAVKRYTQDPLDHPYRIVDKRTKTVRMSNKSEREEMNPPVPPGDVGWFSKHGPLVSEFYEAAKLLKPGEIGGPIQTPYGFHLIKMIEIQNQPTLTFEQCRERVLRLYVEKFIQVKSLTWIRELVDRADLTTERAMLWPIGDNDAVAMPTSDNKDELDPVVGRVNGAELRRSEVWRELFRAEADEALDRLVNRAVVLNMLKELGVERMEWECAHPEIRAKVGRPRVAPIKVPEAAVDEALTYYRLRWDRYNEERRSKAQPEITFKEFLFDQFGQTEAEYKRVLEASLVLHEAVSRRVETDEKTLRVQFYLARENYNTPERYDVSHILIIPTGGMNKARGDDKSMAAITAQAVYDQLKADPDSFAVMVRDFSMDSAANKGSNGKVGACYAFMPDNPENEAIYREIKAQKLEEGMFTTPFAGERGFHIARLDKIHKERTTEFEFVKDQVKTDYLNERAKSFVDIWLRALKDPLDNPEAAKVKVFLNPENEGRGSDMPRDNFPLPRE
jgi:parvulin-like peptidyl-prolyl isomerase